MDAAGYSDAEAAAIKAEIAHYAAVRDEVKLGAGENIDFKQYEAGMRFLLDTYIQADASEIGRRLRGHRPHPADRPAGRGRHRQAARRASRTDPEAVAETIANNMRKVIIDEHAMNPKYYDKMSELLDALIEQRQQGAIDYKEYLEQLIAHAQQLGKQRVRHRLPGLGRQRRQACARRLRLARRATLAIADRRRVMHTKPDRWVGNRMKERRVKQRHPPGAARATSTGSTNCST